MNGLIEGQHFHILFSVRHLAIGDRKHRVPIHENYVHAWLKKVHQYHVFPFRIHFLLKESDGLTVELHYEILPVYMPVHHEHVCGQRIITVSVCLCWNALNIHQATQCRLTAHIVGIVF